MAQEINDNSLINLINILTYAEIINDTIVIVFLMKIKVPFIVQYFRIIHYNNILILCLWTIYTLYRE